MNNRMWEWKVKHMWWLKLKGWLINLKQNKNDTDENHRNHQLPGVSQMRRQFICILAHSDGWIEDVAMVWSCSLLSRLVNTWSSQRCELLPSLSSETAAMVEGERRDWTLSRISCERVGPPPSPVSCGDWQIPSRGESRRLPSSARDVDKLLFISVSKGIEV